MLFSGIIAALTSLLIPIIILLLLLPNACYVVEQQHAVIIERLGKFNRIVNAGFHMKVPVIDRKAATVSLRTMKNGFGIDIQTDVPVARGLGSSSTCVVAGIMAAAALTGHTVDRAELVRIATEVEGHPDNVAPAILGGAVCSFTPTDSLPQCLRYEVSDRLRFITVIPPYEVHTSEARKVVPQEVPLSTAVWQMGRIAGMTRGLESGNLDLIAAANDDRIQEPYRRRLIPDYNAVRDTCLNGGAKTIWISGSGSTLMAVTDDTIVAKFLQVKLREQFPKCDTHILTCDTDGAQIEYL